MKLSKFGEKFSGDAGILALMDDLGRAMAQGDMIMMGGGNPGVIPEVQQVIQHQLQDIVADEQAVQKLIGIYDPPQGKGEFLEALAHMLRAEFGWPVSPSNICLTNGSQAAFFLLFNMFAGEFSDGTRKKILLPMAPEYIGYADLGLCSDFFLSVRPRIECIGEHLFKYRVDFNGIDITEEVGAICVSRPTNPTGNVLTDAEIHGLSELALEHDLPLIIDSAYGVPFPGMVYTDITPLWNENSIVSMSLSKFGLPATRTGIVIAGERYIKALSGMNAVVNLAPGSLGATVTTPLIRSGEMLRLSREVIRPFYQQKMKRALDVAAESFAKTDYKVHTPEGSMFLWFWFPGLPITSAELYQRLKRRKVLVVPGESFFPGIDPEWSHVHECIRVNYSQNEEEVHEGIRIIADEIRAIFATRG